MSLSFTSLLFLSLLSLILLSNLSLASHLKCDTGKSDIYRYEALVDAFGGPVGENDEENREEFTLTATVAVTCVKKFKSQEHRNELSHLNVFNIQNAELRLKTNANWKSEASLTDATAEPPMQKNIDGEYDPVVQQLENKLLEHTTYYIQSENGKVYNVYHVKEEDPLVTNMKKAILQELQTKVQGDSRVEKTTEGIVKGHYKRAQGDDGTIFLERSSGSADVIQDSYKPKNGKHQGTQQQHRRLKQDSTVALTPDGRVKEVVSEKKIMFGQHSKRRHKMYEKMKGKLQYEKGMHSPKVTDYFTGKTKAALVFLQQIDISAAIDHSTNVDVLNDEVDPTVRGDLNEDDDLSPEDEHSIRTKVADHIKEATLMADDDLFSSLDDIYKKRLSQTTDLPQILNKLHLHHKALHQELEKRRAQDMDDSDLTREEFSRSNMNLVAAAQQYCRYLPENCLNHAQEFFNMLSDVNAEENHSITHIIQSLLSATQTKEGQKALVDSMKNIHLIQHGILRTLDLFRPNKKIINKLKSLVKGEGIPEEATEEERQMIRDNAYMALSDAAGRIPPSKGLTIVQEIMDRMLKAESEDDLVLHVHALGNAGNVVPVEALRKLITSEGLGDRVKFAAIDGLRRHISPHTDREVTNILHNVIAHPKMHPLLKGRAINTLTEREIEMSPRRRHSGLDEDDSNDSTFTAKYLERFLHDPNLDDAIKKSILEYYYEEGSDESGDLVENFFMGGEPIYTEDRLYDDDLNPAFSEGDSDMGLWRRVRRGVRRIGRAVRRAVRAVSRAVNTVVKAAAQIAALPGKVGRLVSSFKKIFQKAHFKGQKVCTVVNNKGSRLCAYDSDMISFLQRQGDLSRSKHSRQFSFEKLIGTEGLHVYVGGLGAACTRIDCDRSELDVSIFGRVSAYSRILDKRTNLITGELELNKFTNRDVHDRVYLKVFGSVMVNGGVLPSKVKKFINRCDIGARKSLVYKNYPSLVNIDIIIPIIIPFSIRLGISAKMGVDMVYTVCPGQMKLSAGVEPFFGLGVSGGAGVSFWVLSGHVDLTMSFDYRLKPSVGLENCQLCAKLGHQAQPFVLSIGGSLKFLSWNWHKDFISWKTKAVNKNLFRYCMNIQRVFRRDDDDMLMSPNMLYWKQVFADSSLDEDLYYYN